MFAEWHRTDMFQIRIYLRMLCGCILACYMAFSLVLPISYCLATIITLTHVHVCGDHTLTYTDFIECKKLPNLKLFAYEML